MQTVILQVHLNTLRRDRKSDCKTDGCASLSIIIILRPLWVEKLTWN